MKKKNLLSLGALTLSLGLVVSGCSTPGQKGETGETGPQGPQGEPGTPGADGKTYADVIVLNDAVEEGYHVTQDVFAVEVGSDESVTFTFTAEEGRPFDVITVVINETEYGPIFASTAEDGTTTATLELTNEQVGNSAQLRRATFATAATYGEDLIDAYHDSIVEKDPQIGHKHDATAEERVELSRDYEEAIELFAEGYSKAKAGLTTELDKLEDDATVQDKIACADKYLETAKKTLDDAYTAAVTAAKATAKEALDDLAATVTSTNYKEEDKTAQLTAAKGAVDAATTIAEIVKLVNETEVENKLEKGTYNKLYSNKSAAFALIDEAIAEVNDEETINEDVVSELEAWGVTVDAIPSKIAEKYYADISAATSFEIDEDGQPELAVKGAKEIRDSLANLYTELYNAIKNSYLAEIDASKVLATDDQKTVARSVISNASEDWKYNHKDAELADYYGTTGDTLIIALEEALAGLGNGQFDSERMVNASQEALADLEKLMQAELDSDADYKLACDATLVTGSETNYKLKNAQIGLADYQVDNPLWEETATEGEYTSKNVTVGVNQLPASVKVYFEDLKDEDGALDVSGIGGTYGVLKVQAKFDQVKGNFALIHQEANELYEAAQRTALGTKLTDDVDLTEDWNEKFADSSKYDMVDVSNARKAFESSSTLIYGDNGAKTKYDAYLEDLAVTDPYYSTKFNLDGTGTNLIESKLYTEYVALKDGILSNEKTQNDVNSYVASMETYYKEDVAKYETLAKDGLAEVVSKLKDTAKDDIPAINAIENRYQEVLKLLETDGYEFNTVTKLEEWYQDALVYVKDGTGTFASTVVASYLATVKTQIGNLTINEDGAWIHHNLWDDGIRPLLTAFRGGNLDLSSVPNAKEAFIQSGIEVGDDGKVKYALTTIEGIDAFFNDVIAVYNNLSESAEVYRPISEEAIPYFFNAIKAIEATDETKDAVIAATAQDIVAVINDWTDNNEKDGSSGFTALTDDTVKGWLELGEDGHLVVNTAGQAGMVTLKIGFLFDGNGKVKVGDGSSNSDALTGEGMTNVKEEFFKAITEGIDGVAE